MPYKTIIAEKPSVAKAIAKIVGASTSKQTGPCGYLEGNGFRVTWAFGHLVGLKTPREMGMDSTALPLLPETWETKIIDEKGNEVAKGDVGELAVKGPGVMLCYFNDEKATNEVLRDGWLLTGDMAQEDEDGFIFLVDRKKDVIISGGENLYPVQIEDFLRAHDAIKDVAVIGLPDKRLGEIAAAIIELKPDHSCTEEEINTFCNDLPRYKRPHKIIFADIPRNPTGKIEKPKLRKIYCGESVVAAQNRG